MTLIPVGGLRARFIHDSLYLAIEDILTQLGWFTASPAHSAVNFLAEPVSWDEQIEYNTAALATGNLPEDDPAEIGSNEAIHTWTFFFDFFAEKDSIGLHVIEDVRDALAGKITAIGRVVPYVPVLNFLEPTPSQLFTVEVTRLSSERPPPVTGRPWTNHWHSLVIELQDTYGDDTSG